MNNREALKERNTSVIFRTFSAPSKFTTATRGDALRSAQRLPLAIIFRAFGACPRPVLSREFDAAGSEVYNKCFEVVRESGANLRVSKWRQLGAIQNHGGPI